MTYKALDIAHWFIIKADLFGESLTSLKIQKLLYYTEVWSQILHEKNFICEQFQAWAHGPAIPEVFEHFQRFNGNPIPLSAVPFNPQIEPSIVLFLNKVYDIYGSLPEVILEKMTQADNPWIQARGTHSPESRCETMISKHAMKSFYKQKYSM